MSIFKTAYDTTVGSNINTGDIKKHIALELVQGFSHLKTLNLITSLNYKPMFIANGNSASESIPFFTHPLVLSAHETADKTAYLVTDIRPYVKPATFDSNDVVARNQTELDFAKSRTILNLAWITGGEASMRNDLMFAANVFSEWLSNGITTRFALDPKDALTLKVIAHFYYQTLFFDQSEFDENFKQKFAIHTITATNAPSKLVFEIFDKIGVMNNIDDFCFNAIKILENVRLRDLNTGLLITVIGNSWFGLNSKEILAVALEHPPTWAAIVYMSLVERTFKNSTIARLTERLAKRGAGDNFLKSYTYLVKSYTEEKVTNEEISFKPFE
jgi:hypothetical protein